MMNCNCLDRVRHASSFPREDETGFSDTVRHKMNTYDDSPVSQPYRRIPPNQLMEVKAHIQKLLDQGVIKPSHSPYASPIVLARKKDVWSSCNFPALHATSSQREVV